ncbi:MAG: acyl-CoA dehydrogenase family protein [Acidimicrobiales bacterium]
MTRPGGGSDPTAAVAPAAAVAPTAPAAAVEEAVAVATGGADGPLIEELGEWLASNWDPDLTVGQWWERLGTAGWAAPSLPIDAYGRGMSRTGALRVVQVIARFGALGPPSGLGLLLAAPTIVAHGSPEQVETYVRDIVTGRRAWCQLFSEPGAGSDLAGLTSRAVGDGDEWIVNGQKVWTSGGQHADLGMLLARTDPDVPKHQGITYFALDMHQEGVEVRPLREMTGRSLFNEVFFTDARVPDAAVIGGVGRGWAVANTTLGLERAGLGSGGGGNGAGGVATPGTVAGDLDRRAGAFVARDPDRLGRRGPAASGPSAGEAAGDAGEAASGPSAGEAAGDAGEAAGDAGEAASDSGERAMLRAMRGGTGVMVDLARSRGRSDDPLVRQGLAQLYTWNELGRMNGLRLKAVREAGGDVPGMPNIAKLSMSHIMRLSRDLGLQVLGAAGTLHAYDDEGRATLARAGVTPSANAITELALLAQAPPIYGGTDQIQRNIIGERVLGLPKEPGNNRNTPFSELAKNG